jgi:hypothetical protein
MNEGWDTNSKHLGNDYKKLINSSALLFLIVHFGAFKTIAWIHEILHLATEFYGEKKIALIKS